MAQQSKNSIKDIYRKNIGQRKNDIEKLGAKYSKTERNKSHLMFNETCYDNDILPTYTNIM